MDNWQYLIVLGLCILITLPLEFGFGARVYRNPRRLVLAMAPMLVIFIAWDILGILRGHWWYSERYLSGLKIGVIPIEEIAFFLVIPICGLLTYEGVRKVWAVLTAPGRITWSLRDGLERVSEEADA